MEQVSSHWREMLRTGPNRGFGRAHPRYRNPLHRIFQGRFLQTGAAYERFDHYLRAGRRVARRQRRAFCLDMLRQVLTLAVCDAHGAIVPRERYTVIGDGFATLGSILREAEPTAHVVFINLPDVLRVDKEWFWWAHPDMGASFMPAGCKLIDSYATFTVAAMQEMNPDVIAHYFAEAEAHSHFFYCCSRVEKQLPDKTITRFVEYPWFGETIFDELCPWHQEFYSFRPPIWRKYDGPIQHRLVS